MFANEKELYYTYLYIFNKIFINKTNTAERANASALSFRHMGLMCLCTKRMYEWVPLSPVASVDSMLFSSANSHCSVDCERRNGNDDRLVNISRPLFFKPLNCVCSLICVRFVLITKCVLQKFQFANL